MHGEVLDQDGNVIRGVGGDYTSGGTGGYRDGLLHHTERKFLNDVEIAIDEGVISPGNHLDMQGELDPCRPGCQPAIRSYIQENGGTAKYYATATGNTFSWETYSDPKLKGTVKQTITDSNGQSTSYRYWQNSNGRWKRAKMK